jgi:hypothetical protein
MGRLTSASQSIPDPVIPQGSRNKDSSGYFLLLTVSTQEAMDRSQRARVEQNINAPSKLARFSPPLYGEIVFLAGGADLGANRLPILSPSLLVFPYKGWADWSPTARVQRGSSIPSSSLWGSGQGCPRLRASDEHSFIVRVLRARRAPGRPPLILLHRAGCEAGWAGQRQDPLFFLSGIFPFLSGISPYFPHPPLPHQSHNIS